MKAKASVTMPPSINPPGILLKGGMQNTNTVPDSPVNEVAIATARFDPMPHLCPSARATKALNAVPMAKWRKMPIATRVNSLIERPNV